MQSVKLNAIGIIGRRGDNVAERCAQNVHARHDAELRDESESKHRAKDYVSRGEDVCSTVGEPTVEQGTKEEDDPGNNGDPVQFAESASDHVAGQMSVRQHGRNIERCWREDESKEDQPADPDDKRKQHEKTQQRHNERNYSRDKALSTVCPYAMLRLRDSVGNLYGATTSSGTDDCGTVFELSPPVSGGAWSYNVLYSFLGNPDGCFSAASLIMGTAGNLYGTTESGGIDNQGTVFEVSPPSIAGGAWTESALYLFGSRSHDGYAPAAR
jgi:uncharacterized repeat protein (TIGR03803 family)